MSSLDPHTLQGMRGCEVGTDGRLLRWYDQMAYDGVDCLTQNEDLSSRTATSSTLAQISQDSLGTHLKGKCVKLLQKHLENGKDTLLRSGAEGGGVQYPAQVSLRLLARSLESWGCTGRMRGLRA